MKYIHILLNSFKICINEIPKIQYVYRLLIAQICFSSSKNFPSLLRLFSNERSFPVCKITKICNQFTENLNVTFSSSNLRQVLKIWSAWLKCNHFSAKLSAGTFGLEDMYVYFLVIECKYCRAKPQLQPQLDNQVHICKLNVISFT